MAYRLPIFNLSCDIWNAPADPLTDPPSVSNVPCQLYANKIVATDFTHSNPSLWFVAQTIRLPAGTDVRFDTTGAAVLTKIECPRGSSVFYEVHQVADFHKGFLNEYRVAYVLMDVCPFPLP